MYYFDHAASTPPFVEALREFSRVAAEFYANPSSSHSQGDAARRLLQQAKRRLAACCQAEARQLILTSGGTEANNLAIRGTLENNPGGRVLLAADVHASSWFARECYPKQVDVVPLEPDGRLSLQRLRQAITRKTVLFSAVHACNEIGTVHDIAAYGAICREFDLRFHCDGVQALGHIPVMLNEVEVDYYTFSAHKFGGPRGVGGVFARTEALAPMLRGGRQEHGLRAGTENLAGLAAAARALELCSAGLLEETARLRRLQALFLQTLREQLTDFQLNSHPDGLPGLVALSFAGTLGANVVAEMSLRGFAIAAGSACAGNEVRPSRIVRALGRSEAEALGTVRISMGRDSDEQTTVALATTLAEVVQRQRALA